MGTFGRSSVCLRGSTGGGVAPPTPSGPPTGGTPPGLGGLQILAGLIVDVPVIMQLVFQQSFAIQFLDRVLDIPLVPQKGDFTVQFLNKVVDAGCARQLPMVQTVQLRSPTRSSTSLFSR